MQTMTKHAKQKPAFDHEISFSQNENSCRKHEPPDIPPSSQGPNWRDPRQFLRNTKRGIIANPNAKRQKRDRNIWRCLYLLVQLKAVVLPKEGQICSINFKLNTFVFFGNKLCFLACFVIRFGTQVTSTTEVQQKTNISKL